MNSPRRALFLLLPLGLAACVTAAPREVVTLPRDFTSGVGDPLRGAILEASSAFAQPARLRGQPAAAARALAAMEYLAVALPQDQSHTVGLDGITELQLLTARREWRGALGVSETAPAQDVMDALFAASVARDAQAARAALSLPAFTAGPDATLARLAALPPLRQTVRAAASARLHLDRQREVPREFSRLPLPH